MKTLVKNSETISGIAHLLAVPINYISAINNGNLQFTKPIAEVGYSFESSIDTASSQIRTIQGDAGVYYDAAIKTFIQGLSLTNLSLLKELCLFRHMLIYQSYGGDYWRLGNKSVGLEFTYSETTQPAIGYELSFSGNLLEPPTWVNPNSLSS